MKGYQIRKTSLLLLLSAVVLVSTSCPNKIGAPLPASFTEYSVNISDNNAPSQKISKTNDGRIVWVNKSNAALYVCADPAKDPFEAYGWYVPGGDKRKTGKIVDGLNPVTGDDKTFTFDISSTACSCASSHEGVKSTPKIIIVQH